MLEKMTVYELGDHHLRGKRVVVRVDYNVPLDDEGNVADDSRIRATLPTLEYLRGRDAAVVILSHLGRPGGRREPKLSLRPVAVRLAEILDRPVAFSSEITSDAAVGAAERLRPGEVLVVENTRFDPRETKNDPGFAAELARLGDVFVNDAFGAAHRAHASTEGIARHLRPAAAGMLMERELVHLGNLLETPERPFVVVLGGAKVSSKIDTIENLLGRADRLCVGGAMACTFFKAMDLAVGRSLVEEDHINYAGHLIEKAGAALAFPTDVVVTDEIGPGASAATVDRSSIAPDLMVVDIGPNSARDFARIVLDARTILWNGPMGVFEQPPFDEGTEVVARAVARATAMGATSVVGGGDTAAAIAAAGFKDEVTHISTGGGASLEFLSGRDLPGVAALTDRAGG